MIAREVLLFECKNQILWGWTAPRQNPVSTSIHFAASLDKSHEAKKNHPVCNQQLSPEYCHSFLWKCCPSTWKIILKCIFQVAGVIGITWISPTNIQTDDVYFDLVQTLTTLFSVTQIWEKLISDYRRSNLTCWHWPLNFSFSLKNWVQLFEPEFGKMELFFGWGTI